MSKVIEFKVPLDIWPRRRDWKAKVSKWLKSVGDEINVGDVIVELEIEKAIMGLESPYRGKVIEIKAKEGDEVGPGDSLALIEVHPQ